MNEITPAHLLPTPIADSRSPAIQALIAQRGWKGLSTYDRIGAAYDFVRDEIRFGYNRSDDLPASAVLDEGYGQCNTKGSLLVALLRALEIPTRVRGFYIDKALQRGAIPPWLYPLAPRRILHSWVEAFHEGQWVPLEGFIIDRAYLSAVQARFTSTSGDFCGYGIATKNLRSPPVAWRGEATYIQREGIVDDLGIFDHPDDLYRAHGTNLRGIRRLAYRYFFRHAMNRTVSAIRRGRATHDRPRAALET